MADRDLSAAAPLGRALAGAGCAHPAILDALTAPIETAWVPELLSTAPRGSLLPHL